MHGERHASELYWRPCHRFAVQNANPLAHVSTTDMPQSNLSDVRNSSMTSVPSSADVRRCQLGCAMKVGPHTEPPPGSPFPRDFLRCCIQGQVGQVKTYPRKVRIERG